MSLWTDLCTTRWINLWKTLVRNGNHNGPGSGSARLDAAIPLKGNEMRWP